MGETRAFYSLGCMYEKGEGVRVDKAKAVEYFKKGAEHYGDA
jgi:TPR repeat protein